jgi:predicted enzyme related to lactoylglutathione lyase
MHLFEIILYVSDQRKSATFYGALLGLMPSLDVEGMTEFDIVAGTVEVKLGLMPETGIARIVTPTLPHPSNANRAPRCELYLKVDNVEEMIERALAAGATMVSELTLRNWGEEVAYLADYDHHVNALARA